MFANTMYRDHVSINFLYGVYTLASAAKTAYSLPLYQQWHVTIFQEFII